MENTDEVKTIGQVSQKKLPIVASASFATLVQAIKNKTPKAQRTFLLQLAQGLEDEELASMNVISQKQIKLRAMGLPATKYVALSAEGLWAAKEGKSYAEPDQLSNPVGQELAGDFSNGGGI